MKGAYVTVMSMYLTHTHIHTHTYIYIHIHQVGVIARERKQLKTDMARIDELVSAELEVCIHLYVYEYMHVYEYVTHDFNPFFSLF